MYNKKEKLFLNKFESLKFKRIKELKNNKNFTNIANRFLKISSKIKYEYNFTWCGIPIIQYPQDIVAIQEIIWETKPDLIIETGIAHGGSLIFSASMLGLLDLNSNKKIKRRVIGIDIDFRTHNFKRFKKNKLSKYCKIFNGSSVDDKIFQSVKKYSDYFKNILVILDSNHTEEHVLRELNLYSNLVSKNNYCIVCDTGLEIWGSKKKNKDYSNINNPYKAVSKFLKKNKNFIIDTLISNKLKITSNYNGYLKKIDDKKK
jgi:cephalosporin hydroxylase